MRYLQSIPEDQSQRNLPVIFLCAGNEVWIRSAYNHQFVSRMRQEGDALFVTGNPDATLMESSFKENIDKKLRGLPKDLRQQIREESKLIQKLIRKTNKNVWKASRDDLPELQKIADHFYNTGIVVDINDMFANIYSVVEGVTYEEAKNVLQLPATEKTNELSERIQNLPSIPENLKLVLKEENRKSRIWSSGGTVNVKAVFGDGAFEALKKEIGWTCDQGVLFTSDEEKIIEGLTWLDANKYGYASEIDVFEEIGDFRAEQIRFKEEQERRFQEKKEKEEKAQNQLREMTKDLEHPLQLDVFSKEAQTPGNSYIALSDAKDAYVVKMAFGDGAFEALGNYGWKYQGRSIMSVPKDNFLAVSDGVSYINENLPYYLIDIEALRDIQSVFSQAKDIREQRQEDLENSRSINADVEIPKPEGFDYKGYQKAGISYALNRNETLIADEMGLGKTIQAIGILNANQDIQNALVVCPASLRLNWRNELNKWLTRDLSVGVAEGKKFPETDIVVINYDILSKHHDKIREKEWDHLILDEFQYIKNQDSRRTQEVVGVENKDVRDKNDLITYAKRILHGLASYSHGEIAENALKLKEEADHLFLDKSKDMLNDPVLNAYREKVGDFLSSIDKKDNPLKNPKKIINTLKGSPIPAKIKTGLSGTPFDNRPKEIWPILHYFDPQKWNNFFTFGKKYCDAQDTRFGWNFNGASNLKEMQMELRSSMMIRRLKSDVLSELPPKQRQVIELPAEGVKNAIKNEWKAFEEKEEMMAKIQARIEIAKISKDTSDYSDAIDSLKKCKQVAFDEISKARKETGQKKIPLVINYLQDLVESGEKVVCFSHHHEVVEAIKNEFGEQAVSVYGKDSKESRQNAVDRFQNDPDCKVFAGSIRAAGVGLTLTASSLAVFAEMDYNPMVLLQAEDRIHRISQENQVLVQYLVLEGSIDANMAQTIIEKMENFEQAFDVETGPLSEGKGPTASSDAPHMHSGEDSMSSIEVTGVAPSFEGFPSSSGGGGKSDQGAAASKASEGTKNESPFAEAATAKISSDDLEAKGKNIDPVYFPYIHQAITMLAERCDGAQERDGVGFNKTDAYVGDYLAKQGNLNSMAAAAGLEIVKNYRRQLPDHIYQKILEADQDARSSNDCNQNATCALG